MRLLVIGFVCVAGAVLGWDAAAAAATHSAKKHLVPVALKESAALLMPHSSTLVVVPIRWQPSNEEQQSQELKRLAARNRRLEALVRVLRNRDAERQP